MSYQVSETGWGDTLGKAAVTGAVAYVAGMVFGEEGVTRLAGMNLSMPAALAATSAAGSIAADLSKQYVLGYIPGNAQYASIESTALGLGVSGGVAAWMLNEGQIINQPALNTALLGAGSYAAGGYLYEQFVQPSVGRSYTGY